MINPHAQKILAELRAAGVDDRGLPSEVNIETAKDGTHWKGTKRNGDQWELIKNNDDSFNCTC